MEIQMKSVREVYRKINKKIGNATQINKNGVPGPIQGQVGIGTMDFATAVRVLKGKSVDSVIVVRFQTKKHQTLKIITPFR